MKTKNNLTYWLGVVITGLTLGLFLQFAQAWTEPTSVPPGGNVGAPLNTGGLNQTKSAGVGFYGTDTNAQPNLGVHGEGKIFGIRGVDSDSSGEKATGFLGYENNGGAFYSPDRSNYALFGTSFGWAGYFSGGVAATGPICTSSGGWKCLGDSSAPIASPPVPTGIYGWCKASIDRTNCEANGPAYCEGQNLGPTYTVYECKCPTGYDRKMMGIGGGENQTVCNTGNCQDPTSTQPYMYTTSWIPTSNTYSCLKQ